MSWNNQTPEGRREISKATRTKEFSGFKKGEKITEVGYTKSYKVIDWCDYYDRYEYIPSDWTRFIPVEESDGYYSYVQGWTARNAPKPNGPGGPQCTKDECRDLKCSGPDWCKCHCDHWWWTDAHWEAIKARDKRKSQEAKPRPRGTIFSLGLPDWDDDTPF